MDLILRNETTAMTQEEVLDMAWASLDRIHGEVRRLEAEEAERSPNLPYGSPRERKPPATQSVDAVSKELLIGALLRILALSEAGDERGHIANEALQGRVA